MENEIIDYQIKSLKAVQNWLDYAYTSTEKSDRLEQDSTMRWH